jgi:glycerol-3-phosphate acyltransferase PlsX
MVSCGPLEAIVASAHFTLGLLPGATLASSAVVVDAAAGPVVLCDAGAAPNASADQLVQHATAAAAYVSVLLGVQRPKVGLLGGRGAIHDVGRRTADALLSSLLEASDVDYVGVVSARRLVTGTDVDVLVADGATGEIVTDLLHGLGRGGRAGMAVRGGVAVLGVGGSVVATRPHSAAVWTAPDPMAPDPVAPDPVAPDLVAAVGLAAASVRSALPAAVRAGLDRLRTSRRASVGLAS